MADFLLLMDQQVFTIFLCFHNNGKENLSLNSTVLHHFEAANLECLILARNNPQADGNIRLGLSVFLVGLLDPLIYSNL